MSEVKVKKDPYRKQRGEEKLARIPVKIEPTTERLPKPDWIRVKLPANNKVAELKQRLRDRKLHSVCEEAACPNLPECFGHGTATFMIMGDKCTRRCSFCDVAHGRPDALDTAEPKHLAESVKEMQLKYVVITSVDRDDLRDGGSNHFAECVREVRALCPDTRVEILVPDFRGRMDVALDVLTAEAPDVFNHNLETAPRLYRQARPGSDYQWSLDLLKKYKTRNPMVATKSGIMVGLGETREEVFQVIQDLRDHDVEMLTVGQYLQPSRFHIPVARYVTPTEFNEYKQFADSIGFTNAACGPMVRSSYHADLQAQGGVVE
ncbi:Lipoyl synthase [Piscirickettsia salmonis]|uniref:Lipoyl synthase n=1 Tax=Piscirickettsia salmonis TaxID=1238 RepID=A0A1L6THF2_PISSA|nr:lipoyl synthase [Piscirickettsia salmonis]AKP72577.2 lipoyl synthase [Piscirickettsia salmonis LF-89 = ATCC VR-1361]ALB23946.1 lipoyl synthase [Piscirickettsia salmonis]ALY04292.1 lipoyl synthase [Piscirickettsia salmonis]AMA43849.1 lipoyl synthase [Piscirickettsia salmonis]AOS36775.1 lipoyl synthase [Piscirickettsia salmonis]